MLEYSTYKDIADEVYSMLNIPESFSGWSQLDVATFENDFLSKEKEAEIAALVDQVMQKYDTSDNVPEDIEDTRDRAIDEVIWKFQMFADSYYNANAQIAYDAYADIVELLENTNIPNVADVAVSFDEADPSVGIYHDTRYITITLVNGAVITFDVEIDQ